LTIQNLGNLVSEPAVKAELTARIMFLIDATAFARDWRNRRIAHRDLSLALEDPLAHALKSASRKQVADALNEMQATLNVVQIHYAQSESRFDIGPAHDGALFLLRALSDGLFAAEASAADHSNRARMQRFAIALLHWYPQHLQCRSG
jgi:hypothetical protein